jgi:hypothetical protein
LDFLVITATFCSTFQTVAGDHQVEVVKDS